MARIAGINIPDQKHAVIALTAIYAMPRFLSRLPYGAASKPVEEFNYEEFEVEPKDGRSVSTRSEEHTSELQSR